MLKIIRNRPVQGLFAALLTLVIVFNAWACHGAIVVSRDTNCTGGSASLDLFVWEEEYDVADSGIEPTSWRWSEQGDTVTIHAWALFTPKPGSTQKPEPWEDYRTLTRRDFCHEATITTTSTPTTTTTTTSTPTPSTTPTTTTTTTSTPTPSTTPTTTTTTTSTPTPYACPNNTNGRTVNREGVDVTICDEISVPQGNVNVAVEYGCPSSDYVGASQMQVYETDKEGITTHVKITNRADSSVVFEWDESSGTPLAYPYLPVGWYRVDVSVRNDAGSVNNKHFNVQPDANHIYNCGSIPPPPPPPNNNEPCVLSQSTIDATVASYVRIYGAIGKTYVRVVSNHLEVYSPKTGNWVPVPDCMPNTSGEIDEREAMRLLNIHARYVKAV